MISVSPEFLKDDAQTLLSTWIERLVHCVFDDKDTNESVDSEYQRPDFTRARRKILSRKHNVGGVLRLHLAIWHAHHVTVCHAISRTMSAK